MRTFIVLLLIVCLGLTQGFLKDLIDAVLLKHEDEAVFERVYKIDLDLPPLERWRNVIRDKNASLWAFKDEVLPTLDWPIWIFKLLPKKAVKLYDPNFAEEIDALAKLTHIDFGTIFLMNFVFECHQNSTSIIAQNKNGTIIHGYSVENLWPKHIARLAIHARFIRNQEKVFEANMIAGGLGVWTGMRAEAFAISTNARHVNTSIARSIWYLLRHKAVPSSYLVRKTLETERDYISAVKALEITNIPDPVFFIVTGVTSNEGVVITRDRDKYKDFETLDVKDKKWFLVQTNNDRNRPEPPEDYRRIPIENEIVNLGASNVTAKVVWDEVLTKEPVHFRSTIWTTVLSAKKGYFTTKVWH